MTDPAEAAPGRPGWLDDRTQLDRIDEDGTVHVTANRNQQIAVTAPPSGTRLVVNVPGHNATVMGRDLPDDVGVVIVYDQGPTGPLTVVGGFGHVEVRHSLGDRTRIQMTTDRIGTLLLPPSQVTLTNHSNQPPDEPVAIAIEITDGNGDATVAQSGRHPPVVASLNSQAAGTTTLTTDLSEGARLTAAGTLTVNMDVPADVRLVADKVVLGKAMTAPGVTVDALSRIDIKEAGVAPDGDTLVLRAPLVAAAKSLMRCDVTAGRVTVQGNLSNSTVEATTGPVQVHGNIADSSVRVTAPEAAVAVQVGRWNGDPKQDLDLAADELPVEIVGYNGKANVGKIDAGSTITVDGRADVHAGKIDATAVNTEGDLIVARTLTFHPDTRVGGLAAATRCVLTVGSTADQQAATDLLCLGDATVTGTARITRTARIRGSLSSSDSEQPGTLVATTIRVDGGLDLCTVQASRRLNVDGPTTPRTMATGGTVELAHTDKGKTRDQAVQAGGRISQVKQTMQPTHRVAVRHGTTAQITVYGDIQTLDIPADTAATVVLEQLDTPQRQGPKRGRIDLATVTGSLTLKNANPGLTITPADITTVIVSGEQKSDDMTVAMVAGAVLEVENENTAVRVETRQAGRGTDDADGARLTLHGTRGRAEIEVHSTTDREPPSGVALTLKGDIHARLEGAFTRATIDGDGVAISLETVDTRVTASSGRAALRAPIEGRIHGPPMSQGRSLAITELVGLEDQSEGRVIDVDITELGFAGLEQLDNLAVVEPTPASLRSFATKGTSHQSPEAKRAELRARAERIARITSTIDRHAVSGSSRAAAHWAAARLHHRSLPWGRHAQGAEKAARYAHRALGYSNKVWPPLVTWLLVTSAVVGIRLWRWAATGADVDVWRAVQDGFLLPLSIVRLGDSIHMFTTPAVNTVAFAATALPLVFLLIAIRNVLREAIPD